ncbi:MAG TPA: DUF4339 domain-containing protein [Planctomicrobium sp.]|nr:DUF4339 domain-containing protein [Planctomicrobium sp.]
MSKWYVDILGDEKGPYSFAQLQGLAVKKTITPDTNVREESGHWQMAGAVENLFRKQRTPTQEEEKPLKRIKAPPVRLPEKGEAEEQAEMFYYTDQVAAITQGMMVMIGIGCAIIASLILASGPDNAPAVLVPAGVAASSAWMFAVAGAVRAAVHIARRS